MTETLPALGILCGGFSRRMGADKAAAILGGETLLLRTVRRLSQRCSRVLVSTRLDGPGAAQAVQMGWDVVHDSDPGGGPLQAMLALLEQCPDGVLVVPVDMPFLPESCASVLAAAPASAACAGYLAGEIVEPLPLLLRTAALPQLCALVAAGERRAGAWRQWSTAFTVDFSVAHPNSDWRIGLGGVNDPESLRLAQARVAAQA